MKLSETLSPPTVIPPPRISTIRAYGETVGLFLLVFGTSVINAARNGWVVVTGTPPGWLSWWDPATANVTDLAAYALGVVWLVALAPWRRVRPEFTAAALTGLVGLMVAAVIVSRRTPSLAVCFVYLSWMGLVVAVAGVFAYRRHLSLADLGLGRVPGRGRRSAFKTSSDTLYKALAGFGAAGLLARGVMAIPGVPTPPSGFEVNGLHDIAAMLVASAHAGVCEELIVVGVLVTVLEAARRPIWEIYATSLVARLVIHLYFGIAAPAALVMAATNVWLFRRTRRLVPLILAHVIVDAAGAVQLVGGPLAIPLLLVAFFAIDRMITRHLARQPPAPQEQT